MLISRSRNFALTPPVDDRCTPDQTLVGAPLADQGDIVSLAEVKKFLPLNVNTYDEAIVRLIKGVTASIENYVRLDAIQKTITSYWYRVPRKAILSRGPHGDITSVTLIDPNGDETPLTENEDYRVEGLKFKRLVGINATGALKVAYVSGYAVADRPEQFAGAILQEISLQFKNRQDPDSAPMQSVGNLSLEARHLLSTLIRRAM